MGKEEFKQYIKSKDAKEYTFEDILNFISVDEEYKKEENQSYESEYIVGKIVQVNYEAPVLLSTKKNIEIDYIDVASKIYVKRKKIRHVYEKKLYENERIINTENNFSKEKLTGILQGEKPNELLPFEFIIFNEDEFNYKQTMKFLEYLKDKELKVALIGGLNEGLRPISQYYFEVDEIILVQE